LATRTPLLLAAPLFVVEAVRSTRLGSPGGPGLLQRYDLAGLGRKLAWFTLPIVLVIGLTLWHNAARFDDPWEVGYRYLSVAWSKRIAKWGLFDYHYLARNLGVVLSSLPWFPPSGGPIQVNGHGLALWLTTPMYLWLFVSRRATRLSWLLLVTAVLVALPERFQILLVVSGIHQRQAHGRIHIEFDKPIRREINIRAQVFTPGGVHQRRSVAIAMPAGIAFFTIHAMHDGMRVRIIRRHRRIDLAVLIKVTTSRVKFDAKVR
jgi:hypothetical protein